MLQGNHNHALRFPQRNVGVKEFFLDLIFVDYMAMLAPLKPDPRAIDLTIQVEDL